MFTRTPIVVQRKLTGQKPKIIRFMKALLRGFKRPGYAFCFFFLSLFLLMFFCCFFFSKSGFRFSCSAVLFLVSLRGLFVLFLFLFFFCLS